MTSISSLSSSNIYKYLTNAAGQGLSGANSLLSNLAPVNSSSSTSNASSIETSVAQAASSATTSLSQTIASALGGAHHHHHAHGGGGETGANFFKSIQSQVTNALQDAQSSGSTADPNQIVEDTISKIFS